MSRFYGSLFTYEALM